VRDDLDLVAANLADGDAVAQVAGAALDLDAVVQELLERGEVVDFVGDGLGAVDDELFKSANTFVVRSRNRPSSSPSGPSWPLRPRVSATIVTSLAYCAQGRGGLGRQQSLNVLLGPF
jgi:hypothetical protein